MSKIHPWTFIPIVVGLLTAIGLWVVYIIAVEDKVICRLVFPKGKPTCKLLPPFISIAADKPPASCVFGQVVNLAASLVLCIAVLRYSQLKSKVSKPWLNILGLLAQSATSIGMTLVANFQLSNDLRVHNTGSVLFFGFGTLVCWIQVVLTFQTNINHEGLKVGIFRCLLAAAISITIILYIFLAAHNNLLHGARTQWALIMIFLFFIGTFAIEFRHSEFTIHCGDDQNRSTTTAIAEYQSDHM
ncbi:transmembrane protein 150C isoform X1 [Scyliorhinus torazame]|uniref:transmembrane protein 150C isoform X1 n=1 Tax=Scyliorhinus torazame TaxID=75743 RepID=UPI003B5C35D0